MNDLQSKFEIIRYSVFVESWRYNRFRTGTAGGAMAIVLSWVLMIAYITFCLSLNSVGQRQL